MSPFDVVNIICESKEYDKDEVIQAYNAFLINKCFSNAKDLVFFANEMNQRYNLDDDQQFDFYMNLPLPRKKRYGLWTKKDAQDENLSLISEHYSINKQRAEEVLKILTPEQIAIIKDKMNKGGRNGKSS